MFTKISKKILRHKFLTVISLLLFILGIYLVHQGLAKDKNPIQYATAAVEKGTLIVPIAGSGQVSASDQIDIKPKISGDAVSVSMQNGQEVKTGDLLAQIDSRDAQKTMRDAQTALETAQLELNKLLAPADELNILQAENALSAAQKNLEELINPTASVLTQAENALISARDSLTKLKFSQESSYQNALEAKQNAEDNLEQDYENAYTAIANAFLDLPTIITELRDILYSEEIAKSESSLYTYSSNITALINSLPSTNDAQLKLEKFTNSAEADYTAARTKYNKNYENYKSTSRGSEKNVIETLLNETVETVRAMTFAVKSETNMLDYWVDYQSQSNGRIYAKITEYQTNLKSDTSKTNSLLTNLLSAQKSLTDKQDAILNAERDLKELLQNQPLDLAAAERTVQEKEDALSKLKNPDSYDIDAAEIAVKEKNLALQDLKNGADELDIRAKKITVQQKQDGLTAAQQNLADYYIRAPFNGIIASVNIKKGDSVSSSAIATLITKQKVAEITLNEIDIAKVKQGQKTNITFDAIPDLNITGQVAEVDTLGTTTQAVVNYGVKIAFDTQDERIKPGMSLSVLIIIDAKIDVLLVPNAAVKEFTGQNGGQGGVSYVEVIDTSQTSPTDPNSAETKILGANASSLPRRQQVAVGLSNDTMTEITSGLNEGDQVVTQTITATLNSSQNQSQQNSGFNPGMMRMMR